MISGEKKQFWKCWPVRFLSVSPVPQIEKTSSTLDFSADKWLAFGVLFLDTCSSLTSLGIMLSVRNAFLGKLYGRTIFWWWALSKVGSYTLGGAQCDLKLWVVISCCTWGWKQEILLGWGLGNSGRWGKVRSLRKYGAVWWNLPFGVLLWNVERMGSIFSFYCCSGSQEGMNLLPHPQRHLVKSGDIFGYHD